MNMNSYTVTLSFGDERADTPEEAAKDVAEFLDLNGKRFQFEIVDNSTGEETTYRS